MFPLKKTKKQSFFLLFAGMVSKVMGDRPEHPKHQEGKESILSRPKLVTVDLCKTSKKKRKQHMCSIEYSYIVHICIYVYNDILSGYQSRSLINTMGETNHLRHQRRVLRFGRSDTRKALRRFFEAGKNESRTEILGGFCFFFL